MEVVALMIKRWNMSPALEEATRLHHQPMASAVNQTLCAIVSLANSACLKLGIGPECMPDLDHVQLDVTARLKIAPERLALIVQTAEAKLAEEKELFNRA
jgi:HD-like signal output (HDOD) protein